MARWFLIIFYSTLLVGAVSARSLGGDPSRHPYLTCDNGRILSFGTSHRAKPVAEFAAIVRWRHETRKRGPGYDNWGLAQDRHITCRQYRKGPYVQCSASAQPCKPRGA